MKLTRKTLSFAAIVVAIVALVCSFTLSTNDSNFAYAQENTPITFSIKTGTAANSVHSLSDLMDGKTYTKWFVEGAFNPAAAESMQRTPYVVFEASQTVKITGYTLTTGDDTASYPGRNPKGWILFGSNTYDATAELNYNSIKPADYDSTKEPSNWQILYQVDEDTVLQAANRTQYEFAIDATKQAEYKYYKLVIYKSNGGGNIQLAEAGFLYDSKFLNVLSSTAGNVNETADNLFDGKKSSDKASKWCVSSFIGANVVFKANELITVSSYTFVTASDNSSNTGRNPKSWTLYGSSDYNESDPSAATWTAIHSVTNDTTMEDKDFASYTFETENMVRYQYYKLDITEVYSGTVLQLGEFELNYSNCAHNWEKSATNVEASCTAPAHDQYTCSVCKETRNVALEGSVALGHDWATQSTDEATCTEVQKLHQQCSRCDATQTVDGAAANGHSWTTKSITEATCTEVQKLYQECDNCDATQTVNGDFALGHLYSNGYCVRCHSAQTSVTCGDFTVVGGVNGTDYEYKNNILTIKTSAPLIISNTDPSAATTADRIKVAYGVSANLTLAGVNIDKSTNTYNEDATAKQLSAFEIAQDSPADVVITLADGTVNYLKSGRYSAGLQKKGAYGSLTIKGTGTLYAYGGQGGAGIGGSSYNTSSSSTLDIAKTVNITIMDCTVIAYGSRLTDRWATSSGNYTPAPGIGSGWISPFAASSYSYNANIKILNATVTAMGLYSSGIGAAHTNGCMTGIVIEGGSVKSAVGYGGEYISVAAIGGNLKYLPEGESGLPKNENGDELSLLKIDNPSGEAVVIDGKHYAPVAHPFSDTSVYAYLTQKGSHRVWVGDTYTDYYYNSDANVFEELASLPTGDTPTVPQAFTVTADNGGELNSYPASPDYTYEDGVLTILSSTPMTITSSGLKTTDRIVIAAENASVTLNNVYVDVTSGTNVSGTQTYYAALTATENNVTIVLAANSENILKGGLEHAGLEISQPSTSIHGPGTLYAYGGENGAGIGTGSGTGAQYSVIKIDGSTVVAVGGTFGAGIGTGKDGTVNSSSYIEITHNAIVSATGGLSACGIGSGYGANCNKVLISVGSTVLAVGGDAYESTSETYQAGNGIGGKIVQILGCSVNAIGGKNSDNTTVSAIRVGDTSEEQHVTNGTNNVYLLVIDNDGGLDVYVDDATWSPVNSSAIDDCNLYLYLTDGVHTVKVGEVATKYCYADGSFHVMSDTLVSGEIEGTYYHWYACAEDGCTAKLNLVACTADTSKGLQTDDTYHWYECTQEGCTSHIGEAEHQYNQEVKAEEYLKTAATCTEDAVYYKSCVCGHCDKSDTAETFSDEGTALGHDFDGEDVTYAQIDGTYHTEKCINCGCSHTSVDENAKEEHTYDTSCSKTCNKCNYNRSEDQIVHNWSPNWTSGNEHYHECLNDGCTAKTDAASHIFKNDEGNINYVYNYDDATETWKHKIVCTVCGEVYGSGYSACSFVTKHDNAKHWQECSVCGNKINETAHSYSDVWKCDTDNTKHWKECTCGYKSEEAAHTFGSWGHDNTNHWNVCEVCGNNYDATSHTLSDDHDETYHWQECEVCGAADVNKEEHDCALYNKYTCSDCGYVSKTAIESLKFTYSGYVVDGDVQDFKVISDENNQGICWNDDTGYDYYWWIITDLDAYLTQDPNGHYITLSNSEWYYASRDDNCTAHPYLRAETDYWVALGIETDSVHYFDEFDERYIYVEGLGYPVYVDYEYIEYDNCLAFFKLPKLKATGESTIQQISSLNFDITGYVLGNNVATRDESDKARYTIIPTLADDSNVEFGYTLYINKNIKYIRTLVSNDTKFENNVGYALEFYIFAKAGYTFADYDTSKVTFTLDGEEFDVEAEIYETNFGSLLYVWLDLPLLNSDHVHSYVWNCSQTGHSKYCEICYQPDPAVDSYEHVYSSNDDYTCDTCGYVRQVYLDELALSISGFEIGKPVLSSTISPVSGNAAYIALDSENDYYIQAGYAIFEDGKLLYDNVKQITSGNAYYLPGEKYLVVVDILMATYQQASEGGASDLYYQLSSAQNVTLNGTKASFVYVSVDNVIAYFILPELSGENPITSVSNVEYIINGYLHENAVADFSVIPIKNDGIASIDVELYCDYNEDCLTDDDIFDKQSIYNAIFTLTAETGYSFHKTPASAFNFEGAEQLIFVEYTPDYTAVKLYFALGSLDEEHVHSFVVAQTDETHCLICDSCGLMQDAENHVYSSDTDKTCNECGYIRRVLNVTHVDVNLFGYGYGAYCDYGNNILATVYATGVTMSYSTSYGIGTDISVGMNLACMLESSDMLVADTDYYFAIVIKASSGYSLDSLKPSDVTLNSYGFAGYTLSEEYIASRKTYTAVQIFDIAGALKLVTFKLDQLSAPHVHTGVKVDKTPATCSSVGLMEHYECSECGVWLDKDGTIVTLDGIYLPVDSDVHTYEFKYGSDGHYGVCKDCGHSTWFGFHEYDDVYDCTCNHEDCAYERNPFIGDIVFDVSNYVVGEELDDITIDVDTSTINRMDESLAEWWRFIVTDIDAHFDAMNKDGHRNDNHFYSAAKGYFRSGTDYYLAVYVDAVSGYRIDDISNENVFVTVNGKKYVAMYFDTYYYDVDGSQEGWAYFKLPILTGTSSIQQMPSIEVELLGYEKDAAIADATITSSEGTVAYSQFAPGCSSGTSDTTNFQENYYYALQLSIRAKEGYDFYGYSASSITLKLNGETISCSEFEIIDGYGMIYVKFDLPGLHTHDFATYDYDGSQHWHVCSVCGYCAESYDHDFVDGTCTVCGYVFVEYIEEIQFTLTGYAVDGKPGDLSLTVSDSNVLIRLVPSNYGSAWGVLDISADEFVHIDDYFVPSIRYGFALIFATDDDSNFSLEGLTESNVTLNGITPSFIQVSSNLAEAIYVLPMLSGKSSLPTPSFEATLSGYAAGNPISSTSFTDVNQVGIDDGVWMIGELATGRTYDRADTDSNYLADSGYMLIFNLTASNGYNFCNFDGSTFEIEGAGEIISFKISDSYDQLMVAYMLPYCGTDHEHSFTLASYDETHHEYFCPICGAKDESSYSQHVYDDDSDESCDCGYKRLLPISVPINLTYNKGYAVNNEARYVYVSHDFDALEFVYGYEDEYIITTSRNYLSLMSGTLLYDDDVLCYDQQYYLLVVFRSDVYDVWSLTADDLKLNGNSALEVVYSSQGSDNCTLAIFELPVLKKPHAHEGAWENEIPATCSANGIKAHFECTTCGKYFDAEGKEIADLTIAKDLDAHSFGEWITETAATCTTDGEKAHKTCSLCGKHFDSEGKEITDLTIEAIGHSFGDWIDEVSASCIADGTKGHKDCSVCSKHFDNEGKEIADLTIEAIGHSFGDWIDEVSASCIADGTKGHKDCSVCGKHFDSEGNEIADLTIAKDLDAHSFGDLISEVPATCTTDGVKAHKTCSLCGKHFDSEGNEISDLTIEATGHSFGDWIVEIAATCENNGVVGHYECSNCHVWFDHEKAEIADHAINAIGHSAEHTLAKSATCVSAGNSEYWYCSVCKKYFGDEQCTTVTTLEALTIAINQKAHASLAKVDAVAATVVSTGNVEYWYCSDCRKCFSDADATVELTLEEIVVKKLAPSVIYGADSEWQKGSEDDLSFTSNASIKDFEGVYVDGTKLDADCYSVADGKLTITLKNSYIRKLKSGTHTIVIRSASGDASATFTVLDNEGLSAGAWVGIGVATSAVVGGGVALFILFKKKILTLEMIKKVFKKRR